MLQTLRPYLTAGIAATGAIAVISVPLQQSDVPVRSVQLSSDAISLAGIGQDLADAFVGGGGYYTGSGPLSDIFAPYQNLVLDFINNAAAIDGHWVLQDPLPLLRQFVENLVSYFQTFATSVGTALNQIAMGLDALPGELQTMFNDLASGDMSDAMQTLNAIIASFVNDPLSALGSSFSQIGQDVINNLGNAGQVLSDAAPYLVSSAMAPFHNAWVETETIAQTIYTDLTGPEADPTGALVALLGAPGSILDAALNQTFYGEGDQGDVYPGLFVPYESDPYDPEGGLPYTGFDALLKVLPQLVSQSITPEDGGEGTELAAAVDPWGLSSAWLGDISHLLDGLGLSGLSNLVSDLLAAF